jgi:hypothetical protein
MKILNYLKKIALLSFFIPVISFSQEKQEKEVMIRIIQDESRRLDNFETDLKLKKRGFKFQLLLHQVEGVYVFASIRDSIYRFTDTSAIRDFSYLKLLELREEDKFNTNRELSVSETGWSYWFYNDTAQWHSFNRKTIGMGSKRIVCTKAIKQLYDVADGKVIKLSSLTTPLYLFFVAVKDYDKDGKPVTELLRRKVKIEWSDAE